MLREEFEKKATKMGDFYLYYTREGDTRQTYLVGTTNFTTPYVAERIKNLTLKEDEVLVWSWNSNKARKLDLKRIKKLVPLSTVLKNHR